MAFVEDLVCLFSRLASITLLLTAIASDAIRTASAAELIACVPAKLATARSFSLSENACTANVCCSSSPNFLRLPDDDSYSCQELIWGSSST